MKTYYNEIDRGAAEWTRQLIEMGLITDGYVDERSIVDVSPDDLVGFDRCHFFSGIAGWEEALKVAGWPEGRPVWTGSAPCQSFSVAGKGKGKDDERHLWPEFYRLIRECRPPVIFGEQVEGAVKHGWACDLQADLEREGYAFGFHVLGSHSIQAPHIRQRIYWVAYALHERPQGIGGGGVQQGKVAEPIAGRGAVDGGMADTNGKQAIAANAGGFYAEPRGSGRVGDPKLLRREREPVKRCGGVLDAMAGQTESWGATGTSSTGFGRVGEDESRLQQLERSSADYGDVEWIYCRDGKHRPIKRGLKPLARKFEPGFIKISYGLSRNLVCCCNISAQKNEGEEINAAKTKTNTGNILRFVPDETREEALSKRGLGMSDEFYQEEILRPEVHGERSGRGYEGNQFEKFAQAIEKNSKELLRGVWWRKGIACTSCGRESVEQRSIEFEDIMLKMPQGSALKTFFCARGTEYMRSLRKTGNAHGVLLEAHHSLQEIWRSLDDEEKERVRVHFNQGSWLIDDINEDHTQEARVMRLKGYGNAIQIDTAAQFIRAFMDVRVDR